MFPVIASKLASLTRTLTAARLAGWYRSHVTYRELMGLDDRQLADIGLSRGEIDGALANPRRIASNRD